MKNRFNNLTSKEWLPFQKSWFIDEGLEKTYREYIRFFVKFDDECPPNVLFWGSESQLQTVRKVADDVGARLYQKGTENEAKGEFQFVLIDLREFISPGDSWNDFELLKNEVVDFLNKNYERIKHRRFVSIFVPNVIDDVHYYPFSWDLAQTVATGITLKDEKIGCYNGSTSPRNSSLHFRGDVYYTLQFRNDEHCEGTFSFPETNFSNRIEISGNGQPAESHSSWEIIKPRRRSKKEILHPAKFPEEVIEKFIEIFSSEGDNIFDPMSGTGSTQLAAMQLNRNGYGTELSGFFAGIAEERLNEYLDPTQKELFSEERNGVFKIINKDAREIKKDDFPEMDYIITSPPYWDMLNMKGAENQAKRREKDLKLSYSDNDKDLGNIADYELFLDDLMQVYDKVLALLKPGGVITIIVKNIKKKGTNYPFAYDISNHLQKRYKLLPEFFWLQDDISIAPYGYGNTFVTNTFHQYCLNFQKPF